MKDLALHAAASLMTLLSPIQAESKTRTSNGGYMQSAVPINASRDEKIQFRELNFVEPPAAKNTREATARNVGTNNNHNLVSSTLTARRSCSKARFRSGRFNRKVVRTKNTSVRGYIKKP